MKFIKDVLDELSKVEVPKKTKIVGGIISLLLSLLIASGIFIVLINLTIFRRYEVIIYLSFSLVTYLFVYSLIFFYLEFITECKVKGLWKISFLISFIPMIIVLFVMIILLVVGAL